ncbi:hypothetical protein N7495_009692 [Penicillium taxi]|uniref:uncharacterized protein n=1 Tax=Penicillium taxi TaxID=168475 RepID=UPI00254555CB|nr:uncharacterized protein N7495_009692 [Penicillium taxi]KAJ5885182.1 hypothetical protein N7495_009692 [Penicillium taxi]
MSSTSPPRSERAMSVDNSPIMLTPGQKIRALMAEFDSDSESDTQIPRSRISKLDFGTETSDKNDTTDEEREENPKGNARFLALVAKKRLEREEREKIQAEEEAVKRAQMEQLNSEILSEEEIERDGTGSAKKLLLQARQPRKASKKAMEEMNRETQRLSRNMQLAHQSQTKKKITKESLFAKFNFMQSEAPSDKSKVEPLDAVNQPQTEADGLSALGESTSVHSPIEVVSPALSVRPKKSSLQLTRPPVRVLMSRQEVAQHQKDKSDSDDDLEVVTLPAQSRRVTVFENLPAQRMQESSSMIKLKALAHLTSPPRKMGFTGPAELSADLLYKARQQAAKERKERVAELRAKGVVIETAEERAAMEDDMENLVEKARQEADNIARQERADRKKEQGIDDEEYDNEYELSGSDEADDSADDESELAPSDDEHEDEVATNSEDEVAATRLKRRARVVSDDEDEEEETNQVPSTPIRPPSNAAQSVERPQFPDMDTPNMSMGLTQAFASTLADDESDTQPPSTNIPFSLPEPGQAIPRLRAEESEILVHDSQEYSCGQDLMTIHSPNIARVSESPAGHAFSQYSQLPDPTQDEGFVFSPFDPSKRFRGTPPVSTVDTVLLGQTQSPIADRKARHLHRGRAADLSMVEEETEDDFDVKVSAFNVMKKSSRKQAVPYDKKTSKAKNIVDEAAEESEDEYAGIGGASEDEEGEENAYDQQMINDNSGETVDEKQLAALNALHQRNRDEKDVAKLMKDITTGALRRRRGGEADEFDLDDSDDERAARRREKQREFAKMRRALLADDKVGELAENPKKAAFFRAIEDREIEDDFELEILEEDGPSQVESSQDVAALKEHTNSAHDSNNRKRPFEPSTDDPSTRRPARLRRTPASALSKKPATLAEIRETLSFLTETHDYDTFHEDTSIDDEPVANNDDSHENTSQDKECFTVPDHPRRTRGPVVDRLSLLRQASSNSASTTASGSNTKSAFQSGKSDGPIGFRPPQLLRRVTTGSSTSSTSSSSNNSHRVTKPTTSGSKKGGAVNSYTAAREKERERQLRAKERNGGSSIAKLLNKHAGGGLGALVGKGQWD